MATTIKGSPSSSVKQASAVTPLFLSLSSANNNTTRATSVISVNSSNNNNNNKVTSVRRITMIATTTMSAKITTKTATVLPSALSYTVSTLFPSAPSNSTATPAGNLQWPDRVTTAAVVPIKAAKATTEAAEIPKKIKDPQTPGDILAFVSLTLGSYIVGALLAIIFRALYKYVKAKYRRKKTMLSSQRATVSDCSLLDPNGRGRSMGGILRPDQHRLSTIFEVPTGSSYEEAGDDAGPETATVLAGGGDSGDDDILVNSNSPIAAHVAIQRNNSLSSVSSINNQFQHPPSPCSRSYNSLTKSPVRKNSHFSPTLVPKINSADDPPHSQFDSNSSSAGSSRASSNSPPLIITTAPSPKRSYYNQRANEQYIVTIKSPALAVSSPARRFIPPPPVKSLHPSSNQFVHKSQTGQQQQHLLNVGQTRVGPPLYVIECFGDGEEV